MAGLRSLGCVILLSSPAWSAERPVSAARSAASSPLVEPFRELRLNFARRPEYTGSWVYDPEREAVTGALEAKRAAEFLSLSGPWLEKCPVDARIHLARAAELSRAGDVAGAAYHRMMFYGLLMSILTSGDGRAKASAYKVISVDEEYTLLNYLGGSSKGQRLDGTHDVLEVDIEGTTAPMYFDVSIALDARARSFGGRK